MGILRLSNLNSDGNHIIPQNGTGTIKYLFLISATHSPLGESIITFGESFQEMHF